MHELLNVLYVQTQGAVLHQEHDTVRVSAEGETKLRAPLLRLGGIVVFGQVTLTPFLIQRCAEDGRSLVWLGRNGRFKARVEGPARGNVLLRRAQHLALSDAGRTSRIARQIVAGKIQNSRHVLLRAAREAAVAANAGPLAGAAEHLAMILPRLKDLTDLDEIRGAEGEAARAYFGVFGHMVSREWRFRCQRPLTPATARPRQRCPFFPLRAIARRVRFRARRCRPRPTGGLLARASTRQAGVSARPDGGVQAVIADRLALTLINRRQLKAGDFEDMPGGGVHLTEDGRKAVIIAYQKRKEEVLHHRLLREKLPLGLVPHVQARLLARHLRGELREYPPFLAH